VTDYCGRYRRSNEVAFSNFSGVDMGPKMIPPLTYVPCDERYKTGGNDIKQWYSKDSINDTEDTSTRGHRNNVSITWRNTHNLNINHVIRNA